MGVGVAATEATPMLGSGRGAITGLQLQGRRHPPFEFFEKKNSGNVYLKAEIISSKYEGVSLF